MQVYFEAPLCCQSGNAKGREAKQRKQMSTIFESTIPNLDTLYVRDPEPQICTWQGREALRLSGQGACLLVIPNVVLTEGCIEVDIGSDGAAYPGIAFRILDCLNYELAYAQPHTSGEWDALQYDPVFHGSNTWQLYHGVEAQKRAEVHTDTWHRLRVEYKDQRALVQVGKQEPLIINHLAHIHQSGPVGLWTYLPAYFSNLRISDEVSGTLLSRKLESYEKPVDGTVTEWFLEGFGVVDTEINGILNLNRYLPISEKEVKLLLKIDMLEDEKLIFNVGYSDVLTLQIDEDIIFQGENLFHDSPKWDERGYVDMNQQIVCRLGKGVHTLTAILEAKEYFGFGMALNIEGDAYSLLPVQLYE